LVWFGLVWIFDYDLVWGLLGPPGSPWPHTASHSFHNPAYCRPWTDKKEKKKRKKERKQTEWDIELLRNLKELGRK